MQLSMNKPMNTRRTVIDYFIWYCVGSVFMPMIALNTRGISMGQKIYAFLILMLELLYYGKVFYYFEYSFYEEWSEPAIIIGVLSAIGWLFTCWKHPFISHFLLCVVLICFAGVTGYFIDQVEYIIMASVAGPVFMYLSVSVWETQKIED